MRLRRQKSIINNVARGIGADTLGWHMEACWRPSLAERFDATQPDGVRVFHDGPKSAIGLTRDAGSMILDAGSNVGSFASLAIELPDWFRAELSPRQILRLTCGLELSRPLQVFSRLNLRHGPDTDVITRALPLSGTDCIADHDLATTGIGERPLQHVWLDLIFERPGGATVTLSDLTFSLHPRAEC